MIKRWLERFSTSGVAIGTTLLLTSSIAVGSLELSRVSTPSPFRNDCNGAPQTGTLYRNAEVEPQVSLDPRNADHLVGVWQQDRWSNGGANGLLTAVSNDGGASWTRSSAHFTRCTGGNTRNGGDYERASDPWVSFGPDGSVYQISLSFNDSNGNQAILASRSRDGGASWSEPAVLTRDTTLAVVLDKESITADSHDRRFAYAVWDRLVGFTSTNPNDFFGPVWFARTTNGGASWEPARIIFDPGPDAQTIGSVVVVLPNGDLLDMFTLIPHAASSTSPSLYLAMIRSTDKGAHWSAPLIINQQQSVGIATKKGEYVRTEDFTGSIAVDQHSGAVYLAWQDARFSGGKRDGIALSRSGDGGRSWSPPVQVNTKPTAQAFTPTVNVTEDGTVGITYYDTRNDTPDPNTMLTSTWLLVSQDRGTTFSESRVAAPFDMRTAPFAVGFFVGDYEGLSANMVPFFVVANTGNLTNRTDVFAAVGGEDQTGGDTAEQVNAQPKTARDRIKAHREVRGDR
jgi:BNR repeat protein